MEFSPWHIDEWNITPSGALSALSKDGKIMRLVIALLIIIYLVGVGVVLSPVVEFDLGQRNGLGLLRQHRARPAGRLGLAGEARARECEVLRQSVGLQGGAGRATLSPPSPAPARRRPTC